jgi:uncharacterized protein with HEPN domain
MPPTVEDRLQDVLEAIQEIEVMLAGMSFEQFSADNIRRMAAERYLEIVCEAARHLPNDVKQRSSEIDWRKMNDFANLLRPPITTPRLKLFGTSSGIICRR